MQRFPQYHVYTVKRILIFDVYDFIYALYCGVCGDEAGAWFLPQSDFNGGLSDRCGVFGCNGDLSDRQIVDRLISAVPEAQNGKGRMKMSPADWIVLAILAALVIAVVMIMVKRRKRGDCCGECSGCAERGCCQTKRDSEKQ